LELFETKKSGQLLDQSNHNVHFQENIAQLICLPVILRKRLLSLIKKISLTNFNSVRCA